MSESVLRIERAKLRQQAFAQVARRHAQRIEFLYDREAFLDVLHRVGPVLRNLFQRCGQIPVLIQIANDRIRNLSHHVVAYRYA